MKGSTRIVAAIEYPLRILETSLSQHSQGAFCTARAWVSSPSTTPLHVERGLSQKGVQA